MKAEGANALALSLYDQAIAARPDYRDARFNKALLLQSLGRLDEALALLDPLCADWPQDGRAASARGTVLLALGRLDEAGDAFDRALALQPGLRTALHGRARVALERGEAGAAARFASARRAAGDDPDLLLAHAEALESEGDPTGLRLLEDALRQRPEWVAGQERLARMRAEAGAEDIASGYRQALGARPGDRALTVSLAGVLAQASRFEEAAAALDSLPEEPPLMLMKALYRGEAGDPAAGLALLERLPQDDGAVQQARGRLALRTGDPVMAVAALERAVALAPASILAWGHLELAWRLTAHPRAAWLSGQPGLHGARDIGLSRSELASLAELLRGLHRTRAHPIGQSLRGGTQTRGRLFRRREPELRRLHEALSQAIAAHMAALPPHDPGHPLLRHRDRPLRIEGSWSVRLTGSGFHVNHIHPEGLLSSACYIALPDALAEQGDRAGWLELGRPPRELGLLLEPLAVIEPRVGRLALFPSYLFHGTRPFAQGERLTVAFDVAAA